MKTQIMSYGGGVQSVAVVAAVLKGKIEPPDLFVIADTSREKSTTWEYLHTVINPALERSGLGPVQIASHRLATVDLYANNGDLLIPAYTETGKLPTFCSDKWKQQVIMRWARAQGVDECQCWIGFSTDEAKRAKPSEKKWFERRFPLLELGMNRADCLALISEMGWPMPHKSACWMCPNMADSDWRDLRESSPDDFAKAVELDREIFEWDGVRLHRSNVPLDEATFDREKREIPGHYQCTMGFCFL